MQSKQAHTDVGITKGERDGAKQGIVRFWKGCAERGLMEWHPLRQLPEFLWATAPHLWQGTGKDARY